MHALKSDEFEQILKQFEAALPLIEEGRRAGVQVSLKRKLAYRLQTSDHPIAEKVLKHVTILSS